LKSSVSIRSDIDLWINSCSNLYFGKEIKDEKYYY